MPGTINISAYNRLDLAVDALDSLRGIFCEARGTGLAHLNPDHFASLLGILIQEMRSALEVEQ